MLRVSCDDLYLLLLLLLIELVVALPKAYTRKELLCDKHCRNTDYLMIHVLKSLRSRCEYPEVEKLNLKYCI